MDEGLGQVSAHLALGDVELLGQQARRATGAAIAFEECPRHQVLPLLFERQGQKESTQEKRSLGFTEWPAVRCEAVDVVVVQQLGDQRLDGAVVRGSRLGTAWRIPASNKEASTRGSSGAQNLGRKLLEGVHGPKDPTGTSASWGIALRHAPWRCGCHIVKECRLHLQ